MRYKPLLRWLVPPEARNGGRRGTEELRRAREVGGVGGNQRGGERGGRDPPRSPWKLFPSLLDDYCHATDEKKVVGCGYRALPIAAAAETYS